MKSFVCIVLLAAAVVAEPPRYRDARYRFERQEQAQSDEAPYPAAGFKPEKEFKLPSRQELSPPSTSYGVPADSYGAPIQTYAAPQDEYGAPRAAEGKNKESNDENKKSNDENKDSDKVENLDGEKKENLEDGADKDAEVVSAQGAYYVLLPGSQLQRVQFQTENDLRNMAYTARLRYSDADRAPVYVYNPVPAYQPTAAYYQLF